MKQMKNKKEKGVTLIALVVTIIVLIILAGISINLVFGNLGIVTKAKEAKEENLKQTAKDVMSLKITNIQIENYTENETLPSLQFLADKLCEDNDMEYVLTQSKAHASLDKIDTTNLSSIYTKLKEYPYEFEINDSLQLASIDGVKVAQTTTNIPEGYIKPSGTLEINQNGEYDVAKYEKVNVNVTDNNDEFANRPYTTEGLSVYSNRVTITDGGYYTDSSGTIYVNITFKVNTNLGKNDVWTIIMGLPNVNGRFIASDTNREYAFYIGTSNTTTNAINYFDRGGDGLSANTIVNLKFKY